MKIRVAILGIVTAATIVAQGGYSGPGRYEIVNEKNHLALALDPTDQTMVAQMEPHGGDTEQWFVESKPEGLLIRSALDGRALTITANARSA
jgi:hypothetical protein